MRVQRTRSKQNNARASEKYAVQFQLMFFQLLIVLNIVVLFEDIWTYMLGSTLRI